jgi:bifunctional enzyme CysN/CysC
VRRKIMKHSFDRDTWLRGGDLEVSPKTRALLKGQRPLIVWFTGLSGSGKSTIANRLDRKLCSLGHHTFLLDGDSIRRGLNSDLDFTDASRVENLRRVSEVAKLMADAGLIVLVAFISPFAKERQVARDIAGETNFVEVYVSTPLEVCEKRDPKGLYAEARKGNLLNFTGIDSAFEVPTQPSIILDSTNNTPDKLVLKLYQFMKDMITEEN